MKKTLLTTVLISFLFLLSCSQGTYLGKPKENLPNDVVLEWNEVAYDAFGGTAYLHSLMAARINAMVHIAMHDAINAVFPVYATYGFDGKDPGANVFAAAASAAHAVLVHEIPTRKGFLDSALDKSLLQIVDGDAKSRGLKLGIEAAQHIIGARSSDGSNAPAMTPIRPGTAIGSYQAVPPFDILYAPDWENVKLFSLSRKDQFRCAPPPALSSDEYADAFNEVKETGKLNSAVRTQDQSASAAFWYEFSEAGWNRVTRIAAKSKNLGLLETARLFALVDIAIADSYTAGWDAKMHYNLWRPYTAIRNAADDGNDKTDADPHWEPAATTPPVQDYPSTHSALGSAAATVLSTILGDNFSFTMSSPTAAPAGSSRTFESFSEAAMENADSRVRAGIHFRFACNAGLKLGKDIGSWIVKKDLRPLK